MAVVAGSTAPSGEYFGGSGDFVNFVVSRGSGLVLVWLAERFGSAGYFGGGRSGVDRFAVGDSGSGYDHFGFGHYEFDHFKVDCSEIGHFESDHFESDHFEADHSECSRFESAHSESDHSAVETPLAKQQVDSAPHPQRSTF